MTKGKVRKPATKKKPVKPKVPPGVQGRMMSLEERLQIEKQQRDGHAARANAAAGKIELLEQLIKERDDAEKEVQADPAVGGDEGT